MTGVEPVPVPARVRRAGLFGVGDEERLTLGEVVHAGSGGEGRGVLSAAVQHHDQRQGAAGVAGGDIEPVGAGTGGVGVGEGVKPARRSLCGRGSGLVRAVGTGCVSAGESAETAESSQKGPASRCPPAGRQRWRGSGERPGAAPVSCSAHGASGARRAHRRAGQGLLNQRGCLDEAPLAGQTGGLSHRCHLACIHGGIPSRGVFAGLAGRTAALAGARRSGQPW